jgi:hypothetical protein
MEMAFCRAATGDARSAFARRRVGPARMTKIPRDRVVDNPGVSRWRIGGWSVRLRFAPLCPDFSHRPEHAGVRNTALRDNSDSAIRIRQDLLLPTLWIIRTQIFKRLILLD